MNKNCEYCTCRHEMSDIEWLRAVEIATAYEIAYYTGDTTGLKLLKLPIKKEK
jgi:hypothetical protein